jgi:hypothetical protein
MKIAVAFIPSRRIKRRRIPPAATVSNPLPIGSLA